ncbi:hypothetical protein [Pseudomarimonas arenosa]|uniref:Uncharacterized protein n=1 Tax=Pseudomarimonas arenosa TaxID=2774145 RepID=A0AAW3ZJM9_9GAMM|nr:hypothetical protein [Pseudomarimonas arenosa]MBD8525130.1 hypothetical protein [Pseudomarimonas arenosa]
MILQVESRNPRPMDGAEAERRHLSLLNCLKRMGFYDPVALIAAAGDGAVPLRESQFVDVGPRTPPSSPR